MNTDQHTQIREALKRSLLIPVFYNQDYEVCESVMTLCFEEGIEIFEFTNRGANAPEIFAKLQQVVKSRFPNNYLGIGTVKTVAEAESFARYKPDFVVSPLVNTEVGAVCRNNGIPWMPGCLTPTEINLAAVNGASVVKIFPASAVAPSFIKAVLAVFPDVYLMPTGGIKAEKQVLQQWFDAGVICVGMGSELLDRQLVQNRNWDQLREKLKQARQTVMTCIS
jgi:2-dehydro-3-deoxyphosphogluconate aldolase/(4S)-4-hydroxy-2-oxoglutarate aldolase